MNLNRTLTEQLLPRVEKPSRYLGTEANAVFKPGMDVRIALAFPDVYDLGLGNLGLHILYAILNGLDGVGAERVYAPGLDMEALLRERGLPLFALESKDSLDHFDGLGFTLQSELTYTNILNILDLAKLPLRTADRREGDPLVFAGGPAVFNPEPLAPFVDFFVIGDGEDAVVEIAELFRSVKGREALLDALALLAGIYVPARYPMETLPDGRVMPSATAPKVRKRITRDLDGATFPVNYIVPFTRQVHDRVNLEVLRGCTQGCRFCQAGMTTRPVRERALERVDDLMKRTLEATGYEEISLVSLSTCDFSRPRMLVQQAVERAGPERVGVSLPSLRLDSFSVELADMVAGLRRTGLTFAPEAASPRLRAVINKWIPDEDLLTMASEAYKRGWDHVKLYFMIGLPTERDDDVEAIADLALRTVDAGRAYNRRARVHTGVSTFVPKPFTPFQWAEQIGLEETERRQDLLHDRFRASRGAVKFGRHDPEETFIEGLITRGDRRVGDLIEAAWRRGARFDAWDEHRDVTKWLGALEDVGLTAAELLRARALDERLPWDHLDILIPKQWFVDDWARAEVLQHAPDCRHSKCHRCGVIDEERALCAHMLRNSIDGRKEERGFSRPEVETAGPGEAPKRALVEPPPIQRLVFRIGLVGDSRFLSHLEAMNAWMRALRRARTPLSYSEGFHPHPRMAFSNAHPLGEESIGDYLDVTLHQRVRAEDLLARLSATAPDGFEVLGVWELPLRAPSLMSAVAGAEYTLYVPATVGEGALRASAEALMARSEVLVPRKRKRGHGMRDVDLRPLIDALEVGAADNGVIPVSVSLIGGEGPSAKPTEILGLLGVDPATARVVKRQTRFSGVVAEVLEGRAGGPVMAEIRA